ncbi:MAG: helix-turn-helix domain-containing protein [Nitrososphaeria archaeon]
MLKTYKYRIYPSEKQKEFFEKSFGCVRFYWSKALEIKLKTFNDNKNKAKEEKKLIPQVLPASLKKDYPFLKEIDSLALTNAQLNLEKAFKMFLSNRARTVQTKACGDCFDDGINHQMTWLTSHQSLKQEAPTSISESSSPNLKQVG